jgi:hypothetical protein
MLLVRLPARCGRYKRRRDFDPSALSLRDQAGEVATEIGGKESDVFRSGLDKKFNKRRIAH